MSRHPGGLGVGGGRGILAIVTKCHMGSISLTFSELLLRVQIPKVPKDTSDLTVFFALLGSAHIKAAHGTLVKLTHGGGV